MRPLCHLFRARSVQRRRGRAASVGLASPAFCRSADVRPPMIHFRVVLRSKHAAFLLRLGLDVSRGPQIRASEQRRTVGSVRLFRPANVICNRGAGKVEPRRGTVAVMANRKSPRWAPGAALPCPTPGVSPCGLVEPTKVWASYRRIIYTGGVHRQEAYSSPCLSECSGVDWHIDRMCDLRNRLNGNRKLGGFGCTHLRSTRKSCKIAMLIDKGHSRDDVQKMANTNRWALTLPRNLLSSREAKRMMQTAEARRWRATNWAGTPASVTIKDAVSPSTI